MGCETTSARDESGEDFRDVLVRVRRIDPSCEAAAVRRYLQEIADADAMLNKLELQQSVPSATFDPWWTREHAP